MCKHFPLIVSSTNIIYLQTFINSFKLRAQVVYIYEKHAGRLNGNPVIDWSLFQGQAHIYRLTQTHCLCLGSRKCPSLSHAFGLLHSNWWDFVSLVIWQFRGLASITLLFMTISVQFSLLNVGYDILHISASILQMESLYRSRTNFPWNCHGDKTSPWQQ